MMRFDIITIFPKIFDSYLKESILKRAQKERIIKIQTHNLRDFVKDKHKKVDDRAYGGGPGMVLKVEPIIKAIQFLKPKNKKSKIIIFSPAGKQFDSKTASQLAKNYNHIILICGRYEGIDERVKKVLNDSDFDFQELSVGPYVLAGGEIPALVLIDAVSRYLPGVLGKYQSLEDRRYGVGIPVFTRPEIFEWPPSGRAFASSKRASATRRRGKKSKKYSVPKILLSGDHKKIEEWRKKHKL